MSISNRDQDVVIPDRFLCPLTLEPFSQPVKDMRTGHIYSKAAIYQWMFSAKNRRSPTCPLTRQPMHPCRLVRHFKLEREISQWRLENNLPVSELEEDEGEDYDEEEQSISPDEQTLTHLIGLRDKVIQNRERRILQGRQRCYK
jgi:hypothetical protein